MSNGSLPRAAMMAVWLDARLRGGVPVEDYAEAVQGEDAAHLVVGLPGLEPQPLGVGAGRLSLAGATAAVLAMPSPGDPVGLAGPAAFNVEALEAGAAVVLPGSGWGLVPELDARTVRWHVHPAVPPTQVTDFAEASLMLRRTLLEVIDALVALDVAAWQPEIPDLLMDRSERPPFRLPPGFNPSYVESLDRAVLCLEVVELAMQDDGGAVSAYEMGRRSAALADLDRAARRVLVGAFGTGAHPGPRPLRPQDQRAERPGR